jgi:cysteine desulfuration protein SufE
MTQLNEIQETFAILDDWEDRYAYLIDLGRNLPPYPDSKRTEDYIVKGCTSQVWMVLDVTDNLLDIQADSDAHIVRGLIALVLAVYNGRKVQDVQNIDMNKIFNDLGLSDHISPNRRNGFFAMVERIKAVG